MKPCIVSRNDDDGSIFDEIAQMQDDIEPVQAMSETISSCIEPGISIPCSGLSFIATTQDINGSMQENIVTMKGFIEPPNEMIDPMQDITHAMKDCIEPGKDIIDPMQEMIAAMQEIPCSPTHVVVAMKEKGEQFIEEQEPFV